MKKREHRVRMKQLAVENELSALDILFGGKIDPHRDKPGVVAKYFDELLRLSPSLGATQLCKTVERRIASDRRFVSNMLKALGDRLYDGRKTFDDIDRAIAGILADDPAIPLAELLALLKKRFPDRGSDDPDDFFKKRVKRLLENIRPSAWPAYQILQAARRQK
jgi:hypothetical protein